MVARPSEARAERIEAAARHLLAGGLTAEKGALRELEGALAGGYYTTVPCVPRCPTHCPEHRPCGQRPTEASPDFAAGFEAGRQDAESFWAAQRQVDRQLDILAQNIDEAGAKARAALADRHRPDYAWPKDPRRAAMALRALLSRAKKHNAGEVTPDMPWPDDVVLTLENILREAPCPETARVSDHELYIAGFNAGIEAAAKAAEDTQPTMISTGGTGVMPEIHYQPNPYAATCAANIRKLGVPTGGTE